MPRSPDLIPRRTFRKGRRLGVLLRALALLVACSVARADEEPKAESATVLSSYGEVNFNFPRHGDPVADLARFVIGLEHRFDERTRMVAELEVEHAVSSKTDPGEVDVEQGYVEYAFGATFSGRAGLFLIPIGLLNENHEPTAYYGVERNFVETAIIPTTWREGGLQAIGILGSGITLQVGLTTSFDLGKWDSNSTDGQLSPLGSVHQELALAVAHGLAGHLAANWRGVPGLLLGACLFAGNGSQDVAGVPHALITLWDAHLRFAPGRLDLSALYARGTIGHTAELNALLTGPVLIPAEFAGWYVQAAYRVWSSGDRSLTPFVRYEQFNTGGSYAVLGPNPPPAPLPTQEVGTLGVNFLFAGGVVLKADVQSFPQNHDQDRLDLGLGWSF